MRPRRKKKKRREAAIERATSSARRGGKQMTLWATLQAVPGLVYLSCGVLATAAGVLAFYPWLSLDRGESLRPYDPFGTILNLTNEGLLPLRDIGVNCKTDLIGEGFTFNNVNSGQEHFSESLTFKHKLSLPCGIQVDPPITRVTLEVSVSYKIWYIPGRRRQSFSMTGAKDSEGRWHWLYNR
jgi:hypothetical protein